VNTLWLVPAAGAIGCVVTYLIWRALEKRHIYEVPNERSMHQGQLAVGAGWAIVVATLLLWPWTSRLPSSTLMLILGTMFALALMGWLDDLWPQPPLWRLAAQAFAVGICLWHLPGGVRLFAGLMPVWLERMIEGLGWLWFINLFNFMDGIDGISGTETIAITLGYVIVGTGSAQTAPFESLALILAGSAAGFLVWNRHPARIILGDTGSMPLGFILGLLLLDLALRGHLAAALILPLHHVADATYTLIKRWLTVPEPWRPHRQHIYQRAVLGGMSVPGVVLRMALLDVVLIGLAVLSLSRPWLALVLALSATIALLKYFVSHAAKTADAPMAARGG
jgi:UDP-N-acetylmuramyl pentapeptide phosphotransferase/UDP-N-acetylglucosamine-1-phosphate transferase